MTYGLTPRQREQCTGRVLRQWAEGLDTKEIAEREVIPEHEVYYIVSRRHGHAQPSPRIRIQGTPEGWPR